MPPKRAKKNASTASDDAIPSFPAPPTAQPTQQDETHTPEQSPQEQATGITQAQKQALIDNLQLEITERARKLRAQYALQAQALRSRLEMRVNRIPTALRKRKIQDLLDEHTEKAEPKPAPAVPVSETVQRESGEERPRKAVKRASDAPASFDDAEDKENTAPPPLQSAHSQSQDLPITKKRTNAKTTAAAANTKAARTASRTNNTAAKPLQPSTVLSPKSHNSRTLPRSPLKPSATMQSPEKASRPPTTAKGPTTATGARAASRQQQTAAKKFAPPAAKRESGGSDSSSGTTIVHNNKNGVAATGKGTGAGTGMKGKVTAAAKKAGAIGKAAAGGGTKGKGVGAAGKKENVAPATAGTVTAGGRTLRKRG